MKKTTIFTCLAVGVALVTTASFALAGNAPVGCCGAVTPMADQAKPEAGAKAYPLSTCIVTDEKLGEMGDPFVFVHQGQEIKLCCKSCKKKFDKAPETYLKKLAQAPAAK